MPEAVVDLPDPMSLPPAASGNADELLSQLAGEQIDRMLNEAEAAPPRVTPSIDTEVQPIATPIIPPVEKPTDAPFEAAEPKRVAAPLAMDDGQHASAIDSQDVSPLIRTLELLNAPLAASPAWVRDLLGTVAILTFINAFGIIVFVLFFRHR